MASLKKPIRLEKWVSTKNGNGDFVETVTKYNMWAEVERIGGNRSSLNGRTRIVEGKIFRMQFRPDFKPTGNWKVVYNKKRYTISSIEEEEERRYWWRFTANG